jgi:hypothetical protein
MIDGIHGSQPTAMDTTCQHREDAVEADALAPVHGASITYRIAFDAQQGRKVFTLQTQPASENDLPSTVGKKAGLSLYAGIAARATRVTRWGACTAA